MDSSEKLAKKFLQSLGFSDILFEPDGNIPPDFLVNKKIAVEVRRLNQNYENNGVHKGLEESEIPLWHKFERTIKNYGKPIAGKSYFVSYEYSRPIAQWEVIEGSLKKHLDEFGDGKIKESEQYEIAHNFNVEIAQASEQYPDFFLLGGYCDFDMGGFVLSEVYRNLKVCIREKTEKISKHKNKYDEWWLVLIDRIGHSLNQEDRLEFSKTLKIEHDWDKVILVNPLNHSEHFVI
ncbi:MAG: hypothetical protein JXR16_00635 [Bermanella sp.]